MSPATSCVAEMKEGAKVAALFSCINRRGQKRRLPHLHKGKESFTTFSYCTYNILADTGKYTIVYIF